MAYVPNEENYFWSLLYHAVLQKEEYKKDYIERLTKMSKIGLSFKLSDKGICILKLKEFKKSNNYIFELPIDLTVYFNTNSVFEINTLHDKYGEIISNNFDTFKWKDNSNNCVC